MHVVLLWSVINEVWFKWVDVVPEKGQTSFFCSMTLLFRLLPGSDK